MKDYVLPPSRFVESRVFLLFMPFLVYFPPPDMGILQTFSLAFIIPWFCKDIMHILDLLVLPNLRMHRRQCFESIINIPPREPDTG
jgi:hypothetical protein